MGIATVNPTTGEFIKGFEPLRSDGIQAKLALAAQAFHQYRQTSYRQRTDQLHKVAQILEQQVQLLGQLMTLEMGKPIAGAMAEVKKCAWVCRYYGDHGEEFLASQTVETDASQSYVAYQPLGPILAVMPWNFPLWQVFRFAAPALMAGNVALLKHASNVPQCALAIEAIFGEAGFGPGVFQTLLIGAAQVAEVIADDRVQAATLTGSEAAGASLAAQAGQVIKKTVLELGGSDPFIVWDSADLEAATTVAVTARMLNNGQSCIAAKRFIVSNEIADAFEQKLLAKFQALKLGDPMDPETDLGPLATPSILAHLQQQVDACVAQGATVLTGGKSLQNSLSLPTPLQAGYFYPPTIVTGLSPDLAIAQAEFFGPVALVFRVSSLDEAIRVANATAFGLGASAWTQVESECQRFITELEAGAVFINGLVKSDPRLPFGGIKRSGYGRELGADGIREFVNRKTIWIK
jgi:succinate-semialdehyde dehydrogenase/glutarate-semialdehyde dehydrogenase